jgi:hypothetical protein
MGVFEKIRKKRKKRDVQVLQIYKGADYTTEDAIGRCDRHLQKFSRKFPDQPEVPKDRKLRKNGRCG